MTTFSKKLQTGRRTLKLWADQPVVDRSAMLRAFHCLVRLIFITIKEFNENSLGIRSGAMTYMVLLSLVPFLAISTAVVKGFGGGDQLRAAAYTYIDSLERSGGRIPNESGIAKDHLAPPTGEDDANLTDHLRSAIDRLFNYVDKTDFATLGTFGVIGILLSVILVLDHIESAMNTIWKVESGRSLSRKLTDYLTLIILVPLSINVAFAASAFLQNPVLASQLDMLIPFAWLQALLLSALPVVIIAVTFSVMYIFFPNTKVNTLPAMFGATLAALLWFGVQNIYIALQIGVARHNAIYGSFATFPLFLIWIYLGWIFILVGAQVAFAAQNIKVYKLIPPAITPALRLSAAFDIMDCVYRNFTSGQSTTEEKLSGLLPSYPPQLISETIDVLEKAEIIQVVQRDGRLLPGTTLEQYDTRAVARNILGMEAPDTNGGNMSRRAIEAAAEANPYSTQLYENKDNTMHTGEEHGKE